MSVILQIIVPLLILSATLFFWTIRFPQIFTREIFPQTEDKKPNNVLFVTAHPDDECMFFAPTILALKKNKNVNINLVCFSTGDAHGLGDMRKVELVNSAKKLGLDASEIIIIDDLAFPDDIKKAWDPVLMAKTLESVIVAGKIDTFK
ncbi:hypothetical protein BB559_000606 [Furculomyces boomerangus]|uniref:N-acetylglucosaminylphosphatidylinositol deacetylase n=1 Tax=Furculomyces boomerangus TaxID=61424 RepID=A0A2T9Z4Q7_9FUNG|nr:hypothetical protein BB559_000606 [Furculomyces boomerangus]